MFMAEAKNPLNQSPEEDPLDILDPTDHSTDVVVDDYKDLEIEQIQASRKNFLMWRNIYE